MHGVLYYVLFVFKSVVFFVLFLGSDVEILEILRKVEHTKYSLLPISSII